jgi:hypothetical protein
MMQIPLFLIDKQLDSLMGLDYHLEPDRFIRSLHQHCSSLRLPGHYLPIVRPPWSF